MRKQILGLLTVSALVTVTACSSDATPPVGGPTSFRPTAGDEAQQPGAEAPPGLLLPPGQEEYLAAVAECMNAAGFGATAAGDSIIFDPTPTEQRSQFQAASDACFAEAEDLAPLDVPVTEALLRLNFDRVAAARRCLEKNGFPAPELGSYQDWRDDLYANTPYDVMADVLAAELSGGVSRDAVERECPDPARFFLDPATPIYEDEVDYAAYRGAEG